jgi:hypothetical protein
MLVSARSLDAGDLGSMIDATSFSCVEAYLCHELPHINLREGRLCQLRSICPRLTNCYTEREDYSIFKVRLLASYTETGRGSYFLIVRHRLLFACRLDSAVLLHV